MRREFEHKSIGTTSPGGWLGRRGFLLSSLIGIGSLAAGWLTAAFFSRSHRRSYEVVSRWQFPGGEGLIIAIGSRSTPQELRLLGEKLRQELRQLDNAIVMVFDDPRAAKLVRNGSRNSEEEKFRSALRRQRAMYLKDAAREEHKITIYDAYPRQLEVIQYGLAYSGGRNE